MNRIHEEIKRSRTTILLTLTGAAVIPLAAMQTFGNAGPIQILAGAAIGSGLGGSLAWIFGCHGAGWE